MAKPPEDKTHVVIAGAGLAGALLAGMFAKRGYRVSLYERRPDPRDEGFVGGRSINLALSTRGIEALKRLGLDQRVLAGAIPMRGRMIHGPTGELAFQPYSKRPTDAINSVSRGGLNIALLNAAAEHAGVDIIFNHRCVDVDLDAPAAMFERGHAAAAGGDGELITVAADLVIGADGAFSAVRTRMQKQPRFDYSQEYLDHGYKELSIPPTARGEFAMEPNALHIWPRGGYMMIALPNQDRSFTCTCFWPFAGPNGFDSVRTDDDIRRFFNSRFPDAAPLMPTLVEDYKANPTSPLVTIRCRPWIHEDKVALVGDAAHAIVPFYGQGMNAAFEDCAVLMDCLDRHRGDGGDRRGALAEYQSLRKANADAIADMAVENFIEMRDKVASRAFRLKKKSEKLLHRLAPRWFTPLYNMVTFSTIPYAEARRRARRQARTMSWMIAGFVIVALIVLAVVLEQLD